MALELGSPSGIFEQSIMALGGCHHLWRLISAATGNITTLEPWQTLNRAMTDSAQRNNENVFFTERKVLFSVMSCRKSRARECLPEKFFKVEVS